MSSIFGQEDARAAVTPRAANIPGDFARIYSGSDGYLPTVDLYRDARLLRSRAIAAAVAEVSAKFVAGVKRILAA